MSGLTTFQIVDAAVHFSLALVWAIVAQQGWRFLRLRQRQSRFFRMLPLVGGCVATAYVVFTLLILIPMPIRAQRPFGILIMMAVNDCMIFTVVALARHMARFFPTPEDAPPGPIWLALNYGSSLCMDGVALASLGLIHVPGVPPDFGAYGMLRTAYQLVMLSAIIWQLFRVARPGVWTPGGAAWVARRVDVVFLTCAVVSLSSWLVAAALAGPTTRPAIWESSPKNLLLDAIAGIGFAVPLAVRSLGAVIRGFLTVAILLAATAGVYLGMQRLTDAVADPTLRPVLDAVAILGLVAVLAPGHAWLRTIIEVVVFRRSHRRRQQLKDFLYTLSPDLGTVECARRALTEVTAVMRLRGAALLMRDGTALSHGAIAFEPLTRLLNSEAGAEFPAHSLVGYELRELPPALKNALTATDVVGVISLVSPRRQWGVLLVSSGLLGATFTDTDVEVLEGFAAQLALTLDGTELLGRAIAVERSLAHSEKLAAIGELAARVAHEIRNPVTAARSLAQQLARAPQSPMNVEHAGLILIELERVERQVAALLRFARREQLHVEPVDLGGLVEATVAELRPRCDDAGITVQLNVAPGVVAPADREKLRQVLINLIENAIDALDDTPGLRQLSFDVSGHNGAATIAVSDSGGGVPAEALPQLFAPFFSLKAKGTGLGLAIAKRTIEAHGGTIAATRAPSGGMTFRIDLPFIASP